MQTTNYVLPHDEVIAWASELYARAVDNKDAAGFAAAFTPDGTLRFGNAPPIVGREAIREAIAGFFTGFAALRHESIGRYLVGDTLILEASVTYRRHDGREVTVQAVTIFRFASGADSNALHPMADQCRIYVDLSPLYAP